MVRTDRAGRDDLINAVIDGDAATVKKLLSNGSDPNFCDAADWTALHFAAQNNDADMAKILLDFGAFHSPRDNHGNTPLSRAVFSYRGGPECISVLLDAGADRDLPNIHGVSPRSLAQTIANYDASKFFR